MEKKYMVTIIDYVPYLVRASSFSEAIEKAVQDYQRDIDANNPKPKARKYELFEVKE